MEEIKKEILSLSDKYSIKCVESANLEEELKSANSQLAQAQQQIMQLDSRYCTVIGKIPVELPTPVLFLLSWPISWFNNFPDKYPLK